MFQIIGKSGEVVASKANEAKGSWQRALGLMGTTEVPGGDALLIKTQSIHTFFMRYPLDIVFLDAHNKVIKVIPHLKPWRLTWIYFRSQMVIERKATTQKYLPEKGETLEFQCLNS